MTSRPSILFSRTRWLIAVAIATVAPLLVTGCSSGTSGPAPRSPVGAATATSPASATPTVAVVPSEDRTPTAAATPTERVYTSSVYHVEFPYPANVARVQGYDERWGGAGGFFQLLALDGAGWSVDEAAEHIASHRLQPYGSQPTIEAVTVDGVDARLIMPSADQSPGGPREAALVIPAPAPVEISGHRYGFIQIVADVDRMREIAASLRFVD